MKRNPTIKEMMKGLTERTDCLTVWNSYITTIVGTTEQIPRLSPSDVLDTLVRRFGSYTIKEYIDDYDIEIDSDWILYFYDAFGSGGDLKTMFDQLLRSVGIYPRAKRRTLSETGSHKKETTDSGTIKDERDRTLTDTPTQSTTVTPSGTVQTVTSQSGSGTNTMSLGAWDDQNFKGAQQDSGSGTMSTTETVTDGKVYTTSHTGKSSDIVENDDNTRTLDTSKSDEGSYSKSQEIDYEWTPEELTEFIKNVSDLDLTYWLAKEIAYDVSITTKNFYF